MIFQCLQKAVHEEPAHRCLSEEDLAWFENYEYAGVFIVVLTRSSDILVNSHCSFKGPIVRRGSESRVQILPPFGGNYACDDELRGNPFTKENDRADDAIYHIIHGVYGVVRRHLFTSFQDTTRPVL